MAKRLLIMLFLLLTMWQAQDAKAQHRPAWREKVRFGVAGGGNYTRLENYGGGVYSYFEHMPRWQAGVLVQYKWGDFLSYAVQPELRYLASSTDVEPVIGVQSGVIEMGLIELPVGFQFGAQLSPIFRPFVTAGIYGAYAVHVAIHSEYGAQAPINRFQAGLNLGLGVDIWKFQLQCRYRWGLTPINADRMIYDRLLMQGYEFSIGVLF